MLAQITRIVPFAVAFILTGAVAAHGGKHHQTGPGGIERAEVEARAYLPPCTEKADDRQQLCLITERNFIEQYVLGKAGDIRAMSSTASSFDENSESEEFKHSSMYFGAMGRTFDGVQACAWRIVIADEPAQPYGPDAAELVHSVCGRLSEAENHQAEARAEKIEAELRAHVTPKPADDWEPRVAGLRDP